MEILVVAVLAVTVIGLVAYPLLGRKPRLMDEAQLDAELDRYRGAVRAGTLCEACLAPNPPGSRFCGECGEPLGEPAPSP